MSIVAVAWRRALAWALLYAAGLFSAGLFSAGLFSAGLFSAGLFSAALFSAALFSAGLFSAGLFSAALFSAGFLSAGLASSDARADESAFRDLVRRYVTSQSPDKPAEPLPGLPRDVKKSIALEYAVLLHKGGKDQAVDAASHAFQRGDQLRVRIVPLNDLYIYVFYEREGGQRLCLQPLSKEAPPLAKHDRAFELPADGSVYELDSSSGEEKLLLVATPTPNEDLAALADPVCKKSDDKLTAEEKVRCDALKARSQKALKRLQEQQSRSGQYRGLLSEQVLTKIGADAQRQGSVQAVLVEPPHNKQTSTFCMAASFRTENEPALFVTISLKTAPATAAKP
ncbi:MAG TPA: DUF4384 domain-containing protein [Pirellulales bacterium]|nr:DUF4384 domain-containing protein [Pirellulales bacterium]